MINLWSVKKFKRWMGGFLCLPGTGVWDEMAFPLFSKGVEDIRKYMVSTGWTLSGSTQCFSPL